MQKIRLSDGKRTAWSGGTTTELWIDPPNASYAQRNFDFRISSAEIATDTSTFTRLDGFDRYLAVLGEPIRLRIHGQERNLGHAELLFFRGEDEVVSYGCTQDFNLMVRRGAPARCYFSSGEFKGPLILFDLGNNTLIILEKGERFHSRNCIVIDLTMPALPAAIAAAVEGMTATPIGIGRTTASVTRFDGGGRSYYLKRADDEEIKIEKRALDFLQGKLAVPRVIAYAEADATYLLTSAIDGEMAFLGDRRTALRALFDGLRQVKQVPIAGCSLDASVDIRLSEAHANLLAGRIDQGVPEPWKLFESLLARKPVEEPCFTHGDYCLPNIFVEGEKAVGFIDLGRAGIGSHWNDLALCFRSYLHNYPEGSRAEFESEYGQPINWELIQFYIDLDELF